MKFILPFLFCFFLVHDLSAQSGIQLGPDDGRTVQILNYKSSSEVKTFQKLELGIKLPGDVQQKVNHFVRNVPVPEEQKLNPFLDWELRVFAEFVYENTSDVIVVDAFYFQDFASFSKEPLPRPRNKDHYSDEEYRSIGSYTERPTPHPFRVRFTPPRKGKWSVTVKMRVQEGEEWVIGKESFQVIKSSNNSYMGISQNKRYLSLGGRTFYPVGLNLPWPETDSLSDPQLYNNLCYTDASTGKYFVSNEGYSTFYVAPRVQEKYREKLRGLSAQGMNYVRMILYPTASEIEWEECGNYTKRLPLAQEMDRTIELAEELGFYIHLDLQIHYSFQVSQHAYYRSWAWDWEHNGVGFCYKQLMGTDDPVDFFTNEEAKKYYKQRLRYILSRWGYSTHIAVLELFSEISNVGTPEADNSVFYKEGENWRAYSDWQKEMAAYIRSQYNGSNHLLTASFAGPKQVNDDIFVDANMDIMTSNIYDFGPQDFASFYARFVSRHFLNDDRNTFPNTESYTHHIYEDGRDTLIRKPMFFSETDPLMLARDSSGIEIRRSMWQAVFSGLAGSLSWETRLNPKIFYVFNELGAFVNRFDLGNTDWYPAASERTGDGKWYFNETSADLMDPRIRKKKKELSAKADISYLRSADGNFVIGVITNKTYNIQSIHNWFADKAESWPEIYSELKVAEDVDTKKQPLRMDRMNKGKYEFYYFHTYDSSTPFAQSTDRGRELKPDVVVPANDRDYMILFMANRKGYDWNLKRKLTKEEVRMKKEMERTKAMQTKEK